MLSNKLLRGILEFYFFSLRALEQKKVGSQWSMTVFLNLFYFTAPFLSKNFWRLVNFYFEAPLKLIIDKFHKES